MDLSHEKRLTDVENRAKSNTHRLEELERRQDSLDDLASSIKVLAVREENVENDVKEIKNDVKQLTSKPAQRWDNMIDRIIMLIVGGVVAYVLAKLGL